MIPHYVPNSLNIPCDVVISWRSPVTLQASVLVVASSQPKEVIVVEPHSAFCTIPTPAGECAHPLVAYQALPICLIATYLTFLVP